MNVPCDKDEGLTAKTKADTSYRPAMIKTDPKKYTIITTKTRNLQPKVRAHIWNEMIPTLKISVQQPWLIGWWSQLSIQTPKVLHASKTKSYIWQPMNFSCPPIVVWDEFSKGNRFCIKTRKKISTSFPILTRKSIKFIPKGK